MGLKGVHVTALGEDAEKCAMRRLSGKVRSIVLAANICWKRVRLLLSRRLWRKLSVDLTTNLHNTG